MTLEELKRSTEVFVSPSDIAPILRCDPQALRQAARNNANILGFPVLVIGSRIRVPRVPFLRFIGEI